jgi:hypothetical protein
MTSEDADALRILSDQLLEHGLDAGAALLRDIAGRMEARTGPRFVDWPEELGVGELSVKSIEVQDARRIRNPRQYDHLGFHGPLRYRVLIEAEPVGTWTVCDVDKPSGRVTFR